MKKLCLLASLALATFLMTTYVAHAQTLHPQTLHPQTQEQNNPISDPILPQMSCEALLGQDFSELPDATTQLLAAEVVTDTGSTYCQVTGYSAPQIHFEVRLPTESWTGRYVQLGCGGFCGAHDLAQTLQWQGATGTCIPDNLDGFVVGASDSGHSANGDAQWAQGAPQLRIDWAYRSEHALVTVANALMTAFYGQEPGYHYFAGCSNGGRQGLMMAQRYPTDFDGILAGAPAHSFAALMIEFAWNARLNTDEAGNQILTPDSFTLLYEAALAACDEEDGLADGLIDDPRACDFDPEVLACADEGQEGCLTLEQIEVTSKLYQGPMTSNGQRLYPSGLPVGSELQWNFLFFGWNPPESVGFNEELSSAYLRYLATWDEPLSLETVRFDMATFDQLAEMNPLYDATDPNLSAFRDNDGKLMIWHGWEDASIPPQGTLSYYQAVQDEMGGLQKTQQFARLFMIPGLAHCTGGSAMPQFEMLTPLVDWVEKGIAPEEVTVEHSDGEETIRTRPIYPYPTVARYDGSGSQDQASNFQPSTPEQVNDAVTWAGHFQSGDQQWCMMVGTELQCQQTPPE